MYLGMILGEQCHVWVRNTQLFRSHMQHYRLICRHLVVDVCLKAANEGNCIREWLNYGHLIFLQIKLSDPVS